MENKDYLTKQVITYIGNKRSLLNFIGKAVEEVLKDLKKDKIDIVDVFAGSGVVSRYLKQYSDKLYCNDLEGYAKTINSCYLSNKNSINHEELNKWYNFVIKEIETKGLSKGFITKLYSPKNDKEIQQGERVFFTTRNAMYIDTARKLLNEVPEPYKTLLLGPLLYEVSTKNNTAGVFKGFYKNTTTHVGQFGGDGKNALKRILSDIELKLPIFSNFSCETAIFQEDANALAEKIPHTDLAYLDPPYNQHPYGSNYFMLNLVNDYVPPKAISPISGIPKNWNKSNYNTKALALQSLRHLCETLDASYLLISFNSEGFISKEEMIATLSQMGQVRTYEQKYNAFRGSRNLGKREIHVQEYLFLVKKE